MGGNVLRTGELSAIFSIMMQMTGVNFEQAIFHLRGATQTPQNAGELQHKLALDSRLSIKVGGNG